MSMAKRVLAPIEYELPLFVLLAFKVPYAQLWPYAPPALLLAAGLAVLGGRLLRRAESTRAAVLLLLVLAVAGDMMKTILIPQITSVAVLYAKTGSAAMFLLAVMLIHRAGKADKPLIYTVTLTVLCVAGPLLNPAFLLFFLPVLLLLMVYEKQTKRRAVSTLFPLLGAVAAGVWQWVTPAAQGLKQLGPIDLEYIFTVSRPLVVVRAIVPCLPVAVMFGWLWFRGLRAAKTPAAKTVCAAAGMLPPLQLLLSFFIAYAVSDGWFYYVSAAVFGQFVSVLYLLHAGESCACTHARDLADRFLRRSVLPLLMVVYAIVSSSLLYPR